MPLRHLLLVALLAPAAGAQVTGAVEGVVHDSVARKRLIGAAVQLVPADGATRSGRTAVSDSIGHFALTEVPAGRYMLGFHHPMLDSLGIEPPLREVVVGASGTVRADLGIPSAARLRATICPSQSGTEHGAVVIGFVRDARTHLPAPSVKVTAEWVELTFTAKAISRRVPRRVTETSPNGWFFLCDVPSTGMMALFASGSVDSTDVVEVQVAGDRFLRRDLYLGPSRTVTIADTTQRRDSVAARRMRVGEGRLSGTVMSGEGRPIAGAQVGIAGGPQTRTNERGQWTLTNLPSGTRMLQARAVTFYPDYRPIDIIEGAPPVHLSLSTFKAVLDTVRIVEARVRNLNQNGFEDRRRSQMGRFITEAEIVRQNPAYASDLFRNMAGVKLEKDEIMMRSAYGDPCTPALYVDGRHLPGISILERDDIDMWVTPRQITGIEVYVTNAPPQFQPALLGCGSIVIWTKSSIRGR